MADADDILRRMTRLRAPERRAEAETAIEQALMVLEVAPPTEDQLSDLADAIESFNDGAFALAAELAAGALRHKTLLIARRPANQARTIPDLKAAFEATRRFLRAQRPPRAS